MGWRASHAGAAGALLGALLLVAACTSGQRGATGPRSSVGGPTALGSAPVTSSSSAPPSSKPAGSATAAPSQSGGVEGASTAPGEKCQVTSTAAVAAAFGAKVTHENVTTSGIGSPLCEFTLAKSAGAFGGLSASAIAKYPASAFAQSKRSSPGAQTVVGLGSSAFYIPKTSTLKVLDSSAALTLQYSGYLAGNTQPSPAQVRAALISLARGYLALN